jgi:glycosyltransferase involved in cell wall biosynthesis
MRILHVITSLKIGGAESALVNFLTVANNNPHEHIVVFFHKGPNVERLHALGIKTYHITGIVTYCDLIGILRLAKLIKALQPSLIHSALWSANIIGRLMARCFSLPIVCDIHGNSLAEGKYRNLLDRLTVDYATKLVAVSSSVYAAYRDNIIATQKNRSLDNNLVTINNGIDYHTVHRLAQQHYQTRKNFGLTDDDFVVGAIGRLEPIKNYNVLISAFAQCLLATNSKKIKLVIVGGGSQEQELKLLCTKIGIKNNVIFTGYRTDAVGFYSLFDCFVLASQSEGLSISLLEALCFGLPIITTSATHQHDVIENNTHGIVIQPGNELQLSSSIKTLFETAGKIESMRQANKFLVMQNFSLNTTINLYHDLYKTLAGCFYTKKKTSDQR